MSEPEQVWCACGYDLRETARDGACPECGLAAEAAYAWWALGEVHRAWAARVLLGCRLTVWGYVMTVPLFVLVSVLTLRVWIGRSLARRLGLGRSWWRCVSPRPNSPRNL